METLTHSPRGFTTMIFPMIFPMIFSMIFPIAQDTKISKSFEPNRMMHLGVEMHSMHPY